MISWWRSIFSRWVKSDLWWHGKKNWFFWGWVKDGAAGLIDLRDVSCEFFTGSRSQLSSWEYLGKRRFYNYSICWLPKCFSHSLMWQITILFFFFNFEYTHGWHRFEERWIERKVQYCRSHYMTMFHVFNISIAQISIWIWSNALYNSRGNQINIAQVIILQSVFTNQIKCWFLMRGENRSTRGKISHSRVENQQTQSTYVTGCGNRTRATLVEGKCSHH